MLGIGCAPNFRHESAPEATTEDESTLSGVFYDGLTNDDAWACTRQQANVNVANFRASILHLRQIILNPILQS